MRNKSFKATPLSSHKDNNYVAQLWKTLQPACHYYVNLFATTEAMKEELYLEYGEVFVQALQKYDPTREAELKTYFSKAMYLRGLNFQKKTSKLPSLLKEEELYSIDQIAENEKGIEEQVLLSEEISKLRVALERLKPEERKFIEDIFFENKSVAELAHQYQASYAKMDSRKRRILKKIKNIFDEI